MSVADSKVVTMVFNNEKFESAVSQTMATLDKLKEKLKFSKSDESFADVGKAAKKMNLGNVVDSVEKVNSRFSVMGVAGITAVSEITKGVMGLGKKLAGMAISGGINRALNIEQAKFTIEGLGKSFDKLKGDINEAVKGTAYGFDEAAKAASSLSASGIEAGKPMLKALRGISGMAAMTGSSYSSMADIFTKVAGQGRLMGGELQQLSSRGMNAAAVLAEYSQNTKGVTKRLIENATKSTQAASAIKKLAAAHGYENDLLEKRGAEQQKGIKQAVKFLKTVKLTERDIRNLASAGAIDFKTFANAMDDTFGEHAKAANKTFTGAMSNIRASLSRLGAQFVTPIIETNDKDALVMDKFVKNYDENLEKIANTAKRSNSRVADAQKEFIENAKKIPKYAGKSDKELGAIYNSYSKFNWNLTTVLQGIQRVFGAFEDKLSKSKFLQGFFNNLRSASKSISLFANAVASSISGPIEVVDMITKKGKTKTKKYVLESSELWKKFQDSIGMGDRDFGNLKDTFKGLYSIFDLFKEIIGEVFNAFSPTKDAVGGFGSAILAVTGAIGRFVSSTVDLIKNSGIIKFVFGTIGSIFKFLVGIVVRVAEGFADLITSLSKNKVLKTFVKTLNNIFGAFKKLWDALKKIGKIVIDALLKPFKLAGKAFGGFGFIFDAVLGGLVTTFSWLGMQVQKAAGYVEAFSQSKGFQSFCKGVEKAVQGVIDVWDNFLGLFKGKISIGDIFSGIGKKLTDGFNGIKNLVGGFKLGDIFSIESSSASTGEAGSKTEETKSLLQKFLDFLIDIKDKIKNAVKGIIDEVSKLDIDPAKIGKALVDGIGKAVTFVGGVGFVILQAIGDALYSVFTNISELLPDPKVIGVGIGNFLSSAFEAIFSVIPTIVKILAVALRTIVSNLYSILSKLGNEIGKAWKEGFSGPLVDAAGKEISPLVEGIKKIFGAAFKKIASFLKDASVTDIINALNSILAGVLLKRISNLVKSVKGITDTVPSAFMQVTKSITGVIDGVTNSMNNISTGMKNFLSGSSGDTFVDRIRAVSSAIKSLAISIAILVGSLIVLSLIPDDKFKKGAVRLLAISVGMGLLLAALERLNSLKGGRGFKQVAKTLAVIGSAIGALAASLILLSLFDFTKIVGSAAVLVGTLAAIGGIMVLMSKWQVDTDMMETFSKSLIKLSAALIIMSGALILLSLANPEKVVNSALMLSLMLIALAGSMAIMRKTIEAPDLSSMAKSMIVLSAAIFIMAAALRVLSEGDQIGMATAAIAISLLSLAAAVAIIQHFNAADALWPLAGALLALGATFGILGSVPFEGIKNGLIAIVGALAALTIASVIVAIVPGATIALLALGGAVMMLGAGMLMAGLGALSFVTAITMLSKISGESLINLRTVIITLIGFIPSIITAVGEGFVQLLGIIAAAGPQLMLTASVLVASFAMGIANSAGSIAAAGLKLLVSLLTSIANNIYRITVLAGEIIIGFINGLAIMVPGIIQAAINLMVKFINGLAMGIEQNTGLILGAVANLLASIINFILSTFQAIFGKIPFIGKKISGAIDGVKGNVNKVLRDGKTAAEAAKAGDDLANKYGNSLSKIAKKAQKAGGDAKANFIKEAKEIPAYADLSNKELGQLYDKLAKDTSKKTEKGGKDVKKNMLPKGLATDSKAELDKYVGAVGDSSSKAKKKTKGVGKALTSNLSLGKIDAKSIKDKGGNIGDYLIKGIDKKKDDVKKAGTSLGKSGGSGVNAKSVIDSFKSGGSNGAQGFVNGLTSKEKLKAAYDAGWKLGKKAKKGQADAIGEESPAKEFIKGGEYAGEGLVIGMERFVGKVYTAGYHLGESAKDSMKKAIASITNEFEDADLSQPVIRPVMDLSDVKMGVQSMSSMLGSEYAVGLAGSIPVNSNGAVQSIRNSNVTTNVTNEFTINDVENGRQFVQEFSDVLGIEARRK